MFQKTLHLFYTSVFFLKCIISIYKYTPFESVIFHKGTLHKHVLVPCYAHWQEVIPSFTKWRISLGYWSSLVLLLA